MPSEPVHTWLTLGVTALLLPLSPEMAAGALVGLPVDPDLDQARAGGRRRLKLYNRSVGAFWSAAWEPYDLHATHRGISHWPIIGTIGRVAYALGGAILLALWTARGTPFRAWPVAVVVFLTALILVAASWSALWGWWILTGYSGIMKALIGLMITDNIHIVADLKGGKRKWKLW